MTTPYAERLPDFIRTKLTVERLLPRLREPLDDATLGDLAAVAKSVHTQVKEMVALPATVECVEARGAWLETVDSLIVAVDAVKGDARAQHILDTDIYGASMAIHTAVKKTNDVFVKPKTYYGYDPDGNTLTTVIAQADYMSGDTFGVHAALTLSSTTGLAFFYEPGSRDSMARANTLLRFYNSCPLAGPLRIALIPTTDCRAAYRHSVEGHFPKNIFPWGKPKIVSRTGTCLTIGNATRMVADSYSADAGKAMAALQAAWLPKGWETGKVSFVPGGPTIAQWVAKHFDKRNAYAFLWFRRSGATGGAHPELDTSIKATADLVDTIKRGQLIENAKIVIIGDRGHGLDDTVDVDLTEYWIDRDSPFVGGDRRMQLALFGYLVKAGYNFMNIGMRSGALEGPALLGVRTVYLEEIYNLQEGRMDQWQGCVPGYRRIELGHVPSASGKKALAETLVRSVTVNKTELDGAAVEVAKVLGAKPQEVRNAIFQAANCEPTPSDRTFSPRPVKDAFTLLCRQWQTTLEVRDLRTALGGAWQDFAWRVRVAIRAAHALHKAQVKQRIAAAYTGPDEGLSEKDKTRLWQAVGTTIDTWQVAGRKGKSRK